MGQVPEKCWERKARRFWYRRNPQGLCDKFGSHHGGHLTLLRGITVYMRGGPWGVRGAGCTMRGAA